MLIEQLMVAHHRIGDLHAQSACGENLEVTALFNTAAVRLMAEFRKSALALREFRTPVDTPKVTVVNQQNVAGGDQQIAYVDGKNGQETPEKSDARSELGSNEPKVITHEQPIEIIPQRETRGGRPEEPIEARKILAGGTPAFAGVRAAQPAVDPLNWPENT